MDSNLRSFIADLYDQANFGDVFEGTKYCEITDLPEYEEFGSFYLVAAWNENKTVDCKIAYNCDALQCDYDFDWYMPVIDGEVYDTEILDIAGLTETSLVLSIEDYIDDLNEIFS